MRVRGIMAAVAVLGVSSWFAGQAFTDEGAKPAAAPEAGAKADGDKPGATPDIAKIMADMSKPGAPHQWLGKKVGEWTVKGMFWEPDGTSSASTGAAHFDMTVGGLWCQQSYSGTYKGRPYQGMGVTGYDNARKDFVNYWFDTMSTATCPARGQLSEDQKTLTLNGHYVLGDVESAFRYVETWVKDDQFTFTAYGQAGGKEMKLMELTYDRKPTPAGVAARGTAAPGAAAPAAATAVGNDCCGCNKPTPQPSPNDGPPARLRAR